MVFIVGGAYQGKMKYAEDNFPDYLVINGYQSIVREELKKGLDSFAELDKRLLLHISEYGSLNKLVVISDEVGYGVVPVDEFERKFRETNGRINCRLAETSETVIRVVCGIGEKIK